MVFAARRFLWLVLLPVLGYAQPVNAPIMGLDDLKPGMQGEVWTVFRGTTPEAFAVEVTGVVRNALGPGKSLILCQLTDDRVQKMGAVAGMSGSPLYIEGKLAGALSYQVQKFETVRYAGFTPIADLLEVGAQSDRAAAMSQVDTGGLAALHSAKSQDGLQPLSPVFAFGGIAPRVVEWLAPKFSALGLQVSSLGGQMSPAAAESANAHPLRAGDAVAVAVASGDITLAATGTVSYVDGDKVIAFGHPMMGLGTISLPMARAEIVTILPSNQSSLKVANTGGIIGTMDQDRLSAVAGRLGAGPAMIPVKITVNQAGEAPRTLNFQAARHPQLTALAVGSGTAQAVLGSNDAGLTNGAQLEANFTFAGGEVVTTHALFSGSQGISQGLADFARDVGILLQNPYAAVYPTEISVQVTPLEENPLTILEYVQLSRNEVGVGDNLSVTIGWRDYQGKAGREVVTVPVAAAWQNRELELVVAPGNVIDQLTGRSGSVATAQLRGFSAYLDFVRQGRDPDGLYVAVVESSKLFVDQTSETRELPGSLARIAQRSDQSRYQQRTTLNPLWEGRTLTGRLVPGLIRKSFKVTD
jgi:hypothetical protein